jgi:galactokinase
VECGLIYALNELFQLGQDRKQLALMAQQAEHAFPGVKCGIMDQFASMNGKKDNVILLDCQTIEHQYFPLELEEYKLVLINSKVHHSLASGEYNVRRQQCYEGLNILRANRTEIKTFRDATVEDVEQCKAQMNKDVYRRCLYVVQEIKRTQQAAQHLQNKELKEFGKLLHETHEGLSKLYDVSCPELDFLVLQAKDHPEIIGSRLMGGGFGGCTINIIQKENAQQIVEQILSDYSRNFEVEAEVYEVRTGNGSHEILQTI